MTNNDNIIPIDRAMLSINAAAQLARNFMNDYSRGCSISATQLRNRVEDYCYDSPAFDDAMVEQIFESLANHPAIRSRLA